MYIRSTSYAAGIVGKNDVNGIVIDCINNNDVYYGVIDEDTCVKGIIAVNLGQEQNNNNYGEYSRSNLV